MCGSPAADSPAQITAVVHPPTGCWAHLAIHDILVSVHQVLALLHESRKALHSSNPDSLFNPGDRDAAQVVMENLIM
jgi:hypothetical protein